MLKKLSPLLSLLLLTISACTISLVPEYSAALETQITKTAKLNDKLYIQLLNADPNKRAFSIFSDQYTDIEAEIHAIKVKNEVRNHQEAFAGIIQNLENAFIQYKNEHKNKTSPLTDPEIILYQNYIRDFWKPLLIAESSLKKVKK